MPQGGIDVAADVGQQFAIDRIAVRLERLKDKIGALLDTAAVGKLGMLLVQAFPFEPSRPLKLVPIYLHGHFLCCSISRGCSHIINPPLMCRLVIVSSPIVAGGQALADDLLRLLRR